jgi:precorrin-6B methylase 2
MVASTSTEVSPRVKFSSLNTRSKWREDTLYTKEPATIGWLMSLFEGTTLWDVGANIGVYTIFAAVKRKCRVVAFEPDKGFFKELAANIELNDVEDRVTALQIGLGDDLSPNHIDALVASQPFPNAIKLDTDGHDRAILEGARETLVDPRLNSVIVEVDKRDMASMEAMRGILSNSGLVQVGVHTCPLTPYSPIAVQHWCRG